MRILALIIGFSISTTTHCQTAQETFKPLLTNKKIATYFSGMWEVLGITVDETNEKLTVYHHQDHFEMKAGIVPDEVDYDIVLVEKSIKDMGSYGEDGKISDAESLKVMGTLFTPFVRASLEHPMMQKKFQMKLAGIENHVHVYLEGKDNNEVASHTLIFQNKEWMVIEGIHGNAKRVFRLSVQDAIDYQREAFKAQKENSRKSWRQFKKFYLNWREKVSDTIN